MVGTFKLFPVLFKVVPYLLLCLNRIVCCQTNSTSFAVQTEIENLNSFKPSTNMATVSAEETHSILTGSIALVATLIVWIIMAHQFRKSAGIHQMMKCTTISYIILSVVMWILMLIVKYTWYQWKRGPGPYEDFNAMHESYPHYFYVRFVYMSTRVFVSPLVLFTFIVTRLKITFDDTSHVVSKCEVVTIYAVELITLGVIMKILHVFDNDWSEWCLLLIFIPISYVVYLFTRRLHVLESEMRNERTPMSDRWRSESEFTDDYDRRYQQLMEIPIKHTILISIMMTSQMLLLAVNLLIYGNIRWLNEELSNAKTAFDPTFLAYFSLISYLMVLVCLYFDFDFADQEYRAFCRGPHKICDWCFKRIANIHIERRGGDESICVELQPIEKSKKTRDQHTMRLSSSVSQLDQSELYIFEQTNVECAGSEHTVSITDRCSCLNRLCAAFKYIGTLEARRDLDEEERKMVFLKFCHDIYKSVINDFVHLVEEHSDDILRISEEWTGQFGLVKCYVTDCALTNRHCGRRGLGIRDDRNDHDKAFKFYQSLFVRAHFYIFHLYEMGLRVDLSSLVFNQNEDCANIETIDGVSIDEVFAAERELIKTRRASCGIDLDTLDGDNAKFLIQTVNKQQEQTLTDAVVGRLAEQKLVDKNDFDSDALEMDLAIYKEAEKSHIVQVIQQMVAVNMIIQYMDSVKCMTLRIFHDFICSSPLYFNCFSARKIIFDWFLVRILE